MLKNKVYDFLKEHLDKFLFGFEESNLSMSLLAGTIGVRDVNLKPDEFNHLAERSSLPVIMKAGLIGNLNISFSVLQLQSKPI